MKLDPKAISQIGKAIDAFVEQNVVIPANATIETKPSKSAKKGDPYTQDELARMGNPNYVTENGWITWE